MYSFNGLPSLGRINTGGVAKYYLMASKAFWCSSFHTNASWSFNRSKGEKTLVLPAKFAINLRKFICPSNLCNSFLLDGGLACEIALALFEEESHNFLPPPVLLSTINTNETIPLARLASTIYVPLWAFVSYFGQKVSITKDNVRCRLCSRNGCLAFPSLL